MARKVEYSIGPYLTYLERGDIKIERDGVLLTKALSRENLGDLVLHAINTMESWEERLETYELVCGRVDELEWSGTRQGPGSGPMFSGDDGTEYPACPVCHQLKEPNGSFIPEAVGHLHTCKLARMLGSPTRPAIPGTQEELL